MSNIRICTTQDYTGFKRITGNRAVSKAHVNKLREAIKANPQLSEINPIVINEKGEIIDGQHRFESLSELKLPVHYIRVKGLNLKDVQELNSKTKSWTPIDYAKSFAELKNQNYIKYLEHKNEYRLNHDITMQYVGVGHPNTSSSFKNGNFRAGDQALAKKYTDYLVQIGEFLPHWKFRATAVALLKCFQHKDYNQKRMLSKMKQRGLKIPKETQYEDAIRHIEKAYNYQMPEKNRIRFF